MNRSYMICLLLAASSISLVGCNKKEETPAPAASDAAATPTTPAPAAAAPAAPAEPVVDVATLPVEEQYEADAEKEITSDNVSAKLDEIEKELAAP